MQHIYNALVNSYLYLNFYIVFSVPLQRFSGFCRHPTLTFYEQTYQAVRHVVLATNCHMISLEYCLLLAENDFQVEIKLINTDEIAQINYLIVEPGNYRK